MSTSYEILRFSKPTQEELKDIQIFSPYDWYEVLDEDGDCLPNEFISLFRSNDPYTANLCGCRFTVPLNLPRIETDYDKMYAAIGFNEEDIKTKKVHLIFGNGLYYEYTNGKEKKQIETRRMKDFDYEVLTKCFAIKMRTLWDSDEVYVYPDRNLVDKYIPDIDKYCYVPINNTMLSRAEIPFLIFERNKGKCYIQRD